MLIQDLRFSLRTLRRSPGFTTVAVLTTALGIGAATAIFSVLHGVLLKPVPFAEPDRLAMVYLNAAERSVPKSHFSVADFIDWRTHDRAFEQVAAFGAWGRYLTLDGAGEPEQIPGTYATSRFFSILGVRPVVGRMFEPGDDEPGRTRSVVISERLWQRHGADPRMVGATITINGDPPHGGRRRARELPLPESRHRSVGHPSPRTADAPGAVLSCEASDVSSRASAADQAEAR